MKPVEVLIRHYAKAIQAAAGLYSADPAALAAKTREALQSGNSTLAEAAAQTTNDREKCRIVAIAACAAAAVRGGTDRGDSPIEAAKELEAMSDPLLRDTLYQHHWLGKPLEEVAAAQELRLITVRQNYARALKLAPAVVHANWRSRGAHRNSDKIDIGALLKGPNGLSPDAQELYVDAMACATRCLAGVRCFYVGPRSMKLVFGRAWIEAPERLSLMEQRLLAAEDRAIYERTKTYTVLAQPDIFTIRVTHVENDDNTRDVSVWWVSGSQPTVVLDGNGNCLGECSPESPSFEFTNPDIPFEFCLREMGTL